MRCVRRLLIDEHTEGLAPMIVEEPFQLIGQLARWLLRGRVSLSTSATTVIAVLGVSGGLLLGGFVRGVDAVRALRP